MNLPSHRSVVTGFTLIEVLLGSVIASVVAGGTMMAFVTAARIARRQNAVAMAEATGYAESTLERLRNHVAVDETLLPTRAASPDTWWCDNLPAPAAGGSESILNLNATRAYRVRVEDCDGVAGSEACFALQVRVCWSDPGCPSCTPP